MVILSGLRNHSSVPTAKTSCQPPKFSWCLYCSLVLICFMCCLWAEQFLVPIRALGMKQRKSQQFTALSPLTKFLSFWIQFLFCSCAFLCILHFIKKVVWTKGGEISIIFLSVYENHLDFLAFHRSVDALVLVLTSVDLGSELFTGSLLCSFLKIRSLSLILFPQSSLVRIPVPSVVCRVGEASVKHSACSNFVLSVLKIVNYKDFQ